MITELYHFTSSFFSRKPILGKNLNIFRKLLHYLTISSPMKVNRNIRPSRNCFRTMKVVTFSCLRHNRRLASYLRRSCKGWNWVYHLHSKDSRTDSFKYPFSKVIFRPYTVGPCISSGKKTLLPTLTSISRVHVAAATVLCETFRVTNPLMLRRNCSAARAPKKKSTTKHHFR